MSEQKQEITLRKYFVPLTSLKAIHFITIIGFVVYFNTLFNGFVWDDYGYIIYNSAAHIFNILFFFGKNSSGNIPGLYFRPLTAAYFTSLYVFFGVNPFMYHFLQVLLCITNAILLFFLLKKFYDTTLSFLLSLIFLVHPLNAESVDFISATIGPLSFLFGFIALLIVARKKNNMIRQNLAINFCLLLSLLVKETGILFFPLIFLYNYLFHKKNNMRILLYELGTLFIYVSMRFLSIGIFSSTSNTAIPIFHTSLSEKLLSIPKILAYYILSLVYPNHLAIDQLWIVNKGNFSDFYFPLTIVVFTTTMITQLGVYVYNKRYSLSAYIFFTAWLILGSIFLLPFFPLDMTVADRWIYFPMVGFLGLLGIFLSLTSEMNVRYRKIILSFLSIILVVLSIRTIIRNYDWKNELILYSHDANVSDNYDLEANLGNAYSATDNLNQAILHTQKSISMHPTDAGYYNLGVYYERIKDFKSAQKNYLLALTAPEYSISGEHPEIMYIEASWYLIASNPKTSIKYELLGLKIYPKSSMLWLEYAVSVYKLHDQKLAIIAINRARSLTNDSQTQTVYIRILTHKSINLET